jgi:TrmH family RNA methyltransferase
MSAPELLRDPAAAMVAAQEARGVRVARLTSELFARIADRDSPAGLAAIVRKRPGGLASLSVPPDAVFVALHEVANPGNLGTIIRTSDAVGAAGVILIGPSADPLDPVSVKASMGAVFSVPVAAEAVPAAFLRWCRDRGIAVAATSGSAAVSLWDVTLPRPVAVLFGSEGTGLPSELLAAGDFELRIPMTGSAESLNLAVAAGILLYEAWRQSRG